MKSEWSPLSIEIRVKSLKNWNQSEVRWKLKSKWNPMSIEITVQSVEYWNQSEVRWALKSQCSPLSIEIREKSLEHWDPSKRKFVFSLHWILEKFLCMYLHHVHIIKVTIELFSWRTIINVHVNRKLYFHGVVAMVYMMYTPLC